MARELSVVNQMIWNRIEHTVFCMSYVIYILYFFRSVEAKLAGSDKALKEKKESLAEKQNKRQQLKNLVDSKQEKLSRLNFQHKNALDSIREALAHEKRWVCGVSQMICSVDLVCNRNKFHRNIVFFFLSRIIVNTGNCDNSTCSIYSLPLSNTEGVVL